MEGPQQVSIHTIHPCAIVPLVNESDQGRCTDLEGKIDLEVTYRSLLVSHLSHSEAKGYIRFVIFPHLSFPGTFVCLIISVYLHICFHPF